MAELGRRVIAKGKYYDTEWIDTDLYCLNCGEQEVWMANDGGDYYQGETHQCSSCGFQWNLPSYPCDGDTVSLSAIREATQQNEEVARVGEQQNCAESNE